MERIIPVLAIVVGLIIWRVSLAIGLDIGTGFEVFRNIVVVVVLWVIGLYVFPDVTLSATWPLGLCALWRAFWPALLYWSNTNSPFWFQGGGDATYLWYATWWFRYGVAAAILAVGYGVKRWMDPRF